MPPPLLPEPLFEEELVRGGEALGGRQVSQVQLPWTALLPQPDSDVSLDGAVRPWLPAEGEPNGALVHIASGVAWWAPGVEFRVFGWCGQGGQRCQDQEKCQFIGLTMGPPKLLRGWK